MKGKECVYVCVCCRCLPRWRRPGVCRICCAKEWMWFSLPSATPSPQHPSKDVSFLLVWRMQPAYSVRQTERRTCAPSSSPSDNILVSILCSRPCALSQVTGRALVELEEGRARLVVLAIRVIFKDGYRFRALGTVKFDGALLGVWVWHGRRG